MFKFSTKMRKSKKEFPGLQNGAVRRLLFGASFRGYKSRQEGF